MFDYSIAAFGCSVLIILMLAGQRRVIAKLEFRCKKNQVRIKILEELIGAIESEQAED